MLKFSTVFCVAALAVFVTGAYADDPSMSQDGNSCPAGNTTNWCGNSQEAIDPNTGIDTLEYVFAGGPNGVIPAAGGIWSGWVEGTLGTTGPNGTGPQVEAELLDFVVIPAVTTGPPASQHPIEYGVFLYCGGYVVPATSPDNAGKGICSAADDVLPSYENSNVKDTFGMGPLSSGVVNTFPQYNPGNSTTLPGGGKYGTSAIAYSVDTNGCTTLAGVCTLVGTVKASAPEPSSGVLLGAMILGLAAIVRRKSSARA